MGYRPASAATPPGAHAAEHQNNAADEISVSGLSGTLADAQTPTSHATSHQNGGGDEVSTATSGANAIPKAGAGGKLDIGWVPLGSTSSTVTVGNDSRLSDSRTPTSHATSHNAGGSDALAIDAAAGTGSLRTLGTSATAACAGNDSRLSDSRIPSIAVDRSSFQYVGAADKYYTANERGIAYVADVIVVASTLYVLPFICTRTGTVERVALNVTTLGASSGARVGVYNNTSNTNLYPSSLIAASDGGELATTSTGFKINTIGSPFTLTAGNLYWLAFNCKATAPRVSGVPAAGICQVLGTVSDGVTIGCGWSVASTYGALPSNYPGSATYLTPAGVLPAVYIRFAT